MKRYMISTNIISDKSEDQWERYLIKAMERAGANITFLTVKEVGLGRPNINGPKVDRYLSKLKVGTEFDVVDVIEGTDLSDPAVRKQLRKRVNQGILKKRFKPGEEARYELAREVAGVEEED